MTWVVRGVGCPGIGHQGCDCRAGGERSVNATNGVEEGKERQRSDLGEAGVEVIGRAAGSGPEKKRAASLIVAGQQRIPAGEWSRQGAGGRRRAEP